MTVCDCMLIILKICHPVRLLERSEYILFCFSTHQTWITMGLCWSANAQVLGKEKFPYKEAVPMSSQLWMKITPAKVIVQIVYSEPDPSPDLLTYKKDLEDLGVRVFLVPTGLGIQCVLKSQLIRLLAYQLPFIQDEDIIVTADVDAFVMHSDIYRPLTIPGKKIWLYRYANTLDSGWTFMMPFIGLKKSVWKTLFNYDTSDDDLEKGVLGSNLPKMIGTYEKILRINRSSTWDLDQDIFTHEILRTGLCSLPQKHVLWDKLHISPKIQRYFLL